MIRLLQILIFGHAHKWKVIDKRDVGYPQEDGSMLRAGTRYHLQCEVCGNLKFRSSSP